ncbi:MAG: N-acetylmuramate alpha-phosphate uridylyltransferase [Pseudomonadota bacterium]|jgi:MurNAc alpha-1-phosphate uridylyltransferase
MIAMILAAGRGERMRPLTDQLPKPLLPVADAPLITWHLKALAKAGFSEIVINTAYLGQKIEDALGNGRSLGVNIRYSREPEGALETAGGILTAQPWSEARAPFLVVNADIFCRWPFSEAQRLGDTLGAGQHARAHLILVPNPGHHPTGDFGLQADGYLTLEETPSVAWLTYSGIGIFHPDLFADLVPGQRAALGPLLRKAIADHQVTGQAYTGTWTDVGTPDRLAALDQQLRESRL